MFEIRRVLISDDVTNHCADILTRSGVEVLQKTKLTKTELIAEIPKYDALIVRSSTKVTSDVIEAGVNLKVIGRAGTGVDNVDVKAATRRGIIVMNAPGGNTTSAAEHTCAMLLAMSRHIAQGTQCLSTGQWHKRAALVGTEVSGKTLAIIGLGRIGREVALRMQGFGMKTIGYDPITPAAVSAEFGVQWLPLNDIWPQADYITVHTPLMPATINLLNADVFARCKKGVRVINCARGGIIDEVALLEALNSGVCAGAALDVFCDEPAGASALTCHPLVTCTPHLGASTTEAQVAVAVDMAEQLVQLSEGKALIGAVNASAVQYALHTDSRPWVTMATALGTVANALCESVPLSDCSTVTAVTLGTRIQNAADFLLPATLVGLMRNTSHTELNLISAPALATSVGIKTVLQHDDNDDGNTVSRVTLCVQHNSEGCSQRVELTGGVSSGQPVLLAIGGSTFTQPVILQTGHYLFFQDSNGLRTLAAVAAALADNGKNAAILSFSTAPVPTGLGDLSSQWSVIQLSDRLRDVSKLQPEVGVLHQVNIV